MGFGLFWINFSENGLIFEDWISDRKMDFDYFLVGLTVDNFIGHPFRGPKIVLVEIYGGAKASHIHIFTYFRVFERYKYLSHIFMNYRCTVG